MLFSGLVTLGGLAAGGLGSDISQTPEDATAVTADSVPIPRSKPSRTEVQAFVETLDLPEAHLDIVNDVPTWMEVRSGPGVMVPVDEDETVIHKADQAHALGFDGTGVRVAVLDTGQDFAHPDLFNVTYRITDAGSDYFLHPVVYDGASLNDYLVFGEPNPTLANGSNSGSNSWYVNTSYSTTVVDLAGTPSVQWSNATDTLTWDASGVPGLTIGEEVRVGFHPDDGLLALWDERPGLILFNDTGAGPPFDSVLVDLDHDFALGDEKRAFINPSWAGFDPEAELVYQDLDLDGIQDISGGVIAFISDGVRELPYASRQIDVLNFTMQVFLNDDNFDVWASIGATPSANLVPGDGDLVVFHGDFNGPGADGAHGTWVTSAIAGQGITGGGAVGPVLQGMAPGAKIIGSGNNFGGTDPFAQMGLYTAMIFVTEGYDGFVDSGDEAHIASNSWGGADWTGWDWSSRFADYVSTIHGDERTLFVFSAGNSGPGYGGRQAPAGGASLMVSGALENYNYRVDPWFGFDGGPNPSYGDTTFFSNRGPSAMGRHYVDALTSGQFGYGSDPLNNNPWPGCGASACGPTDLNGNTSWVLWAGTSLSTPNLSGVTALIYDAYMAAHFGLAPVTETAKAIVKNSADDAHQDPFMTGAGIANALRGVKIANEMDGLTTSIHEWNPGDYHGTSYPSYANVLFPGSSDMVDVTLENHRQAVSMDVEIEDAVLNLTSSISMEFSRVKGAPDNVFLLNDSGIMDPSGTLLVSAPASAYSTSDAIRVTMYYQRFRLNFAPQHLLRLYDWTDVNADGSYDAGLEENLIVQDFLGLSFGPDEVIDGPNGFAFVHDPANRTHDGIAIVMRVADDSSFPASPYDVTIQVDYFKRMDFNWLTPAIPMVTIPPASTVPVTLDVTVPADADIGLYEAVVLFKLDDGNVTTLPVVVNVATQTVPTSFGGNSYDAGPYQQGVQYGSIWNSGADVISSADFRYYFIDVPSAGNVSVRVQWDEDLSENEIHVLSNVTDWFSDNFAGRYGPGTMEAVAVQLDGSTSSAVGAPLNPGLAVIVVRSTWLAGVSVQEHPTGDVGLYTISPSEWTGSGIPINGSQTFTVTSDLTYTNLTITEATGSLLQWFDQPVDPFPPSGQPTFEQYLYEAPNRLKTEIGSGVSEATYTLFYHSGARDVDMGIFYDGDCDGTYLVGDLAELAGTLANPETATISSPAAGCYWVHAAGYDVDPGSLYDLTLGLVEQPFIVGSVLPASIDAGVPTDIILNYSFPHINKTFGGTVFIGSVEFPEAMPISVSLTPNLPPVFANETPAPGSLTNDATPTISVDMKDAADSFETAVDTATVDIWVDGMSMTSSATITATRVTLTPSTLSEGVHDVIVQAADTGASWNASSWSFTVDTVAPSLTITSPTVNLTNDPVVTISGTTDPGTSVTVNGSAVTVNAAGGFTTDLTLPEGDHSIPVVATDGASNTNSATVEITVDTTPPAVSITSPADDATVEDATVTVTGTTEVGATLTVNGASVSVGADGSFSTQVTLQEGANTITASATDAAGNEGTDSISVTYTPPEEPPPEPEPFPTDLLIIIVTAAAAVVVVVVLVALYLLRWKK